MVTKRIFSIALSCASLLYNGGVAKASTDFIDAPNTSKLSKIPPQGYEFVADTPTADDLFDVRRGNDNGGISDTLQELQPLRDFPTTEAERAAILSDALRAALVDPAHSPHACLMPSSPDQLAMCVRVSELMAYSHSELSRELHEYISRQFLIYSWNHRILAVGDTSGTIDAMIAAGLRNFFNSRMHIGCLGDPTEPNEFSSPVVLGNVIPNAVALRSSSVMNTLIYGDVAPDIRGRVACDPDFIGAFTAAITGLAHAFASIDTALMEQIWLGEFPTWYRNASRACDQGAEFRHVLFDQQHDALTRELMSAQLRLDRAKQRFGIMNRVLRGLSIDGGEFLTQAIREMANAIDDVRRLTLKLRDLEFAEVEADIFFQRVCDVSKNIRGIGN